MRCKTQYVTKSQRNHLTVDSLFSVQLIFLHRMFVRIFGRIESLVFSSSKLYVFYRKSIDICAALQSLVAYDGRWIQLCLEDLESNSWLDLTEHGESNEQDMPF